jgi:hypothetical protein
VVGFIALKQESRILLTLSLTQDGGRQQPASRVIGRDSVRRGRGVERSVHCMNSESLQEFDQIRLLRRGEMEPEVLVVVIDDGKQIRRAAIVEVRRMLQESS